MLATPLAMKVRGDDEDGDGRGGEGRGGDGRLVSSREQVSKVCISPCVTSRARP